MKKLILFLAVFLFLFFYPLSSKAETDFVPFILEDITVDFSVEGYMPVAKCEDEAIASLISYFAIDTTTSSPVQLPLTVSGTFQIFASFSGNEKYEKYETSAFVTIEPIEAKIITNYKTVAYSKMENPIVYTIEPAWASDFLEISIDYYPIESIDSPLSEKIDVPVQLGLYYTVFNVNSKSKGVICENKYMVYEIAAYRGKKLSADEKSASVPESFTCTFQKLNTVYSEDTPITVQYTLSPAGISGEIKYKQVFTDGTASLYTQETPKDPGEYICGYFLGNTCIGEGSIFIDKQDISITVDESSFIFTESGIVPTAKSDKENVSLSFTAFLLDENGNVTMEEVPIPIKRCGKFSIIAYPKDTKYFKRTYSYGYIEIIPATPEIKISKTEFIYDGSPKDIEFSLNYDKLSVSVDYYEWEDRNSKIPIGSAPSRPGKYLVTITAFDNKGNYNTISKSSIMYIDEVEEKDSVSKKDILILTLIGATITGAVGVGIVILVKWIKRKKHGY